MQIGVITNLNSRKNRGKPYRAMHLQHIIGNMGEVHQTDSTESIKPILRDFLRKKVPYWVADGGDGSLHWMLRCGMEVLKEDEFRRKGVKLPPTMPTKGGSIDFVAQNVGLTGNAESLLHSLRSCLEKGTKVAQAAVDSIQIEGIKRTKEGDKPFLTWGFAVAAGGIGQRFFTKLYQESDHSPASVVKVLTTILASFPISMTPLRHVPVIPKTFREYAGEVFKPTPAKITLDGRILPYREYTGIHIASMSINIGGVFRFFHQADVPGQLHAIVGCPKPIDVIRNLHKLHLGEPLNINKLIDEPCKEMTIEAQGDELLAPVIDGEFYHNIKRITFKVGPRIAIPQVPAA